MKRLDRVPRLSHSLTTFGNLSRFSMGTPAPPCPVMLVTSDIHAPVTCRRGSGYDAFSVSRLDAGQSTRTRCQPSRSRPAYAIRRCISVHSDIHSYLSSLVVWSILPILIYLLIRLASASGYSRHHGPQQEQNLCLLNQTLDVPARQPPVLSTIPRKPADHSAAGIQKEHPGTCRNR